MTNTQPTQTTSYTLYECPAGHRWADPDPRPGTVMANLHGKCPASHLGRVAGRVIGITTDLGVAREWAFSGAEK